MYHSLSLSDLDGTSTCLRLSAPDECSDTAMEAVMSNAIDAIDTESDGVE